MRQTTAHNHRGNNLPPLLAQFILLEFLSLGATKRRTNTDAPNENSKPARQHSLAPKHRSSTSPGNREDERGESARGYWVRGCEETRRQRGGAGMETSAAMGGVGRGESAVGLRIGGEIDGEFTGEEAGGGRDRGEVEIGN